MILYKGNVLHCELPSRISFSPAVVVISWFPMDLCLPFIMANVWGQHPCFASRRWGVHKKSETQLLWRGETWYPQQLGHWEKEKLNTTGHAPCLRTGKSMRSNSDYTCHLVFQSNIVTYNCIALKKKPCFCRPDDCWFLSFSHSHTSETVSCPSEVTSPKESCGCLWRSSGVKPETEVSCKSLLVPSLNHFVQAGHWTWLQKMVN